MAFTPTVELPGVCTLPLTSPLPPCTTPSPRLDDVQYFSGEESIVSPGTFHQTVMRRFVSSAIREDMMDSPSGIDLSRQY
ncbi:hypothetical protein CEXT_343551 [Caerostris extrusa]|uniref:Uncharacterized protein n=1 Tax=Caerostris extrusa TaxID=172846 RepID=A0AAV4YCH2_CAEEX|nr:hypothetical protein CEXT_343551 [Caerostris extrusa]